MKLLIVDDEELTRTGLISSIDWKKLGIDEILQADDGINGLKAARNHRPEIILCDVRMPRMTGIAMLEQLENILPDSIPIFMSGYSDKEYLKAAIRLKTVNYIEKPLDLQEVQEAVKEAVRLYRQKLHTHRGEALHIREQSSRLSQLLSSPYKQNAPEIESLVHELSLDIRSNTSFVSIAVKIDADTDADTYRISLAVRDFLKQYGLSCLYSERRIQYLIYFIYGPSMPSERQLREIRGFFLQEYAVFPHFSITAGETVTGISRACKSYTSAIILLQSSFFFPANSFLSPNILKENPPASRRQTAKQDTADDFLKLLLAKDRVGCLSLLAEIFQFYDRNLNALPNQAKDLYYNLFRSLDEASRRLMMVFSQEEGIVDTLEKCFSCQELHAQLLARTEDFFSGADTSRQENPTVFLIRDYISQNYMNASLSVKDISGHVFLSASYLCTLFKNETGQTLNQYLTEFRMEKAKQLLADPRFKISEVSSRVGYSDGNYFGKSFKKHTGLSPSEYREKLN